MQVDGTIEHNYSLQRNETNADSYPNRNGKTSTIKQRLGPDKAREDELQKLMGDKLSKRYSSKKRPAQARNGNQQTSGYNYNVHAMSSALVQHQYNQALASDCTVQSIGDQFDSHGVQGHSKLTGFNDSLDQLQDFSNSPSKVKSTLTNRNHSKQETFKAEWQTKSPDVMG